MYRKTYVEIDCNKLENNIKKIINCYNDYKYYIAVVKNNAYQHGIDTIEYMIKSGINYLAVSSLEEAIKIRSINKDIPVLVLEPIHIDDVKDAIKNNITITIDNKDYFDKLKDLKYKFKFHLKLDTGMHRFGLVNKEDVEYIFNNSNKDMYMEGIYSHLASGNPNNSIFKKQMDKWMELTSLIDLNKIDIIHMDRSLTMELHPKLSFTNGVRLGMIMYGFSYEPSSPSFKGRLKNFIKGKKTIVEEPKLKLETVCSFKSEVIEVKDVYKNDIVGYAGMYTAKKDTKVAVAAYGFADFAYIEPGMNVYINDKPYKVIVNSMDAIFIEVDESVKVGDKIEVFGIKNNIKILAHSINKNVYQLLSSVTNRVPRVLKYGGKEKEIKY